jgi:hypothetical protein
MTALSEDGILDGKSRIDDGKGILQSKASFPFLSAARLFRDRSTSNVQSIDGRSDDCRSDSVVKFNTRNENDQIHNVDKSVIASVSGFSDQQCTAGPRILVQDQWTREGPPPHWADELSIAQIIAKSQHIRDEARRQEQEEDTQSLQQPLHFASGFLAVSQALQENIFATFGRLVSNETDQKENRQKDATSTHVIDSDSAEKRGDDVKSLVMGSEPSDPVIEKKRLGIATLAGSIVGGVAGLAMAGPVGGLIGVKCGQTAGILGLLLEGSFTVGVFAAGSYSGRHLVEKIEEKTHARVLALGEGTNRQVLLLIRPSIPEPGAVWEQIYAEARRAYSGGGGGIVERMISSEAHRAKQQRYEREVDIVNTEEDEIPTADKVRRIIEAKNRINSNLVVLYIYIHMYIYLFLHVLFFL